MALVSVGWRGNVTLLDNGGNQTTKSYELTGTDATEAAADMTAILAALGGVTDALVLGYTFGEAFAQDSGAFPASGVEIQNLALIDTSIVGELTKTATYTIPAPKPAIFVALAGDGANVVNTVNAAVVAYQAIFATGGHATISDGEVAANIIGGRRIHRRSRRG